MSGEIRPLPPDLGALKIEREPEEPQKKRRWFGWAVLLLVLAAAAWVLNYFWTNNWNLPKVRIARALRISPEQANAVLTSSGYLVPRRKANLGVQVSGRITKLNIEEGSRLKEGDVIAEIDPQDYIARRNEAKANLADANRELERQKNLLKGEVGTQQAVDAQQTRVDVFKAQLELAEFNLKHTKVYAPFDGIVIQKMAELGEMLSSGVVVSGSVNSGAICVLADQELEFEADVNETNFTRITEGQEAEIVLDAFPNQRYQGKIRLIQPRADRQKAVVQSRVRILNPSEGLRPEMGGKVTFLRTTTKPTAQDSYVQLPKSAVVERMGKSSVLVLNGDRVQTRPVEIRKIEGEHAQIVQGLQGGEQVIVSPAPEITDGAKVKIQE